MAARTPKKPKRSTEKAAPPVRPAQGTEFLRKKIADQKRLLQAAYEETERTREKLLDAQDIADRALLASERANDKVLVMQRDLAVIDTASKVAARQSEEARVTEQRCIERLQIAEHDLAIANERLREIDSLAVKFRELFLNDRSTEATWTNGVPSVGDNDLAAPQGASIAAEYAVRAAQHRYVTKSRTKS